MSDTNQTAPDPTMTTAIETEAETGPCQRYLLARKSVGAVELCHCGAVHLSIGGVTLRLVPNAVSDLADLLADAAAELPILESVLAHRLLAPKVTS